MYLHFRLIDWHERFNPFDLTMSHYIYYLRTYVGQFVYKINKLYIHKNFYSQLKKNGKYFKYRKAKYCSMLLSKMFYKYMNATTTI